MHVLKREHCPRVCCTHHAFSVKKCFYRSWDYVCPVCVCTQGDLACDLGKTQQAGAMMQPVTAWLSLFCLEKNHPPPTQSPKAAQLTQICYQLHAESEECCLKFCPKRTDRGLDASPESGCTETEKEMVLVPVSWTSQFSICVTKTENLENKLLLFSFCFSVLTFL